MTNSLKRDSVLDAVATIAIDQTYNTATRLDAARLYLMYAPAEKDEPSPGTPDLPVVAYTPPVFLGPERDNAYDQSMSDQGL